MFIFPKEETKVKIKNKQKYFLFYFWGLARV